MQADIRGESLNEAGADFTEHEGFTGFSDENPAQPSMEFDLVNQIPSVKSAPASLRDSIAYFMPAKTASAPGSAPCVRLHLCWVHPAGRKHSGWGFRAERLGMAYEKAVM